MDILSGEERIYQSSNAESKHDAIFPCAHTIFYWSLPIISFTVLSPLRGGAPGASHDISSIQSSLHPVCQGASYFNFFPTVWTTSLAAGNFDVDHSN